MPQSLKQKLGPVRRLTALPTCSMLTLTVILSIAFAGVSIAQEDDGETKVDTKTPVLFSDGFESCNMDAWPDTFPTPIPALGPDFWLRSDVGVTSNNGFVSEWADLCGPNNNNPAFMTVPSRQPQIVDNALNGFPVLRFDGAQSLRLDTQVGAETFTVFVVGKNNNPSEGFGMILGPVGTGENTQLRWESGTEILIVSIDSNLAATTSTIGDTRVYHAFSVRFDGSTLNVYRDGNFVSAHAITTTGPWRVDQIGAWFSTFFLEGELAEIMVYHRPLSDLEHDATSLYLKRKYGLP